MSNQTKYLSRVKELERNRRIQQGFFDGRFKNKVVEDEKKETNKKSCRNFNKTSNEEE